MMNDLKTYLAINEPSEGYTRASQIRSLIVKYLECNLNGEKHSSFGSNKCSPPEQSTSTELISFDKKTSKKLHEFMFNYMSENFSHIINFHLQKIDRSFKIYDYITDNERSVICIDVHSEEIYDEK